MCQFVSPHIFLPSSRPSAGAIDQLPGYANSLVPIIMDAAATAGLKVAFLIEPYEGRNAFSVRDDMKEIINVL